MNEHRITITRTFLEPREKVWEAWTTPELIKQWFGPEGFTAPNIRLDLREGGKYVYTMRGPAGSEWDKDMYSAGIFQEIIPMEKIVATDYFSDAEGNPVPPSEQDPSMANFPPELVVTTSFEDSPEGGTKLTVSYQQVNDEQYQAMKDSGMEEGWRTTLDKLAAVVST